MAGLFLPHQFGGNILQISRLGCHSKLRPRPGGLRDNTGLETCDATLHDVAPV